jgi:hypothetical protein
VGSKRIDRVGLSFRRLSERRRPTLLTKVLERAGNEEREIAKVGDLADALGAYRMQQAGSEGGADRVSALLKDHASSGAVDFAFLRTLLERSADHAPHH